MKKRLGIILLVVMCALETFAQGIVSDYEETEMTLPDGAVTAVKFFKNWSDANKYLQMFDISDFHTMVGITAKTEKECGYFRKTYKENENDSVAAICAIHKKSGTKYSVAWLDFGDDFQTRCVFTYKGGKLIYDRMDFFKESNELYKQYIAEKKEKEEKMIKITRDITKAVLKPFVETAIASVTTEIKPVPKLYTYMYGREFYNFYGYEIIHDDGHFDKDYIIDTEGNFRRKDSIHGYPIVKETIVPKKTREAVAKMFE